MNDLRRHIMMQQGGGSILPPEYQQVEWIQCTGTQGLLLPAFFSFRLVVADLENIEGCVLGQYQPAGNPFIWTQNGRIKFGNWGQHSIPLTPGLHTFEYAGEPSDIVVADGIPSQGGHTNWRRNFNARLFLETQVGKGRGKFVYLETISNDMKLYPCYRKSDNEAGAYDIVNDIFYTNAGAGSFIVGPDV